MNREIARRTTREGDIIMDSTMLAPENIRVPRMLLVKVPEQMYQTYFELAQVCYDKNDARRQIFQDLQRWVADTHPAYGMIAFEDFSTAEAKKVSAMTGYPLTWGMYLVLELGGKMTSMGSTVNESLLQSPLNTIEDVDYEEENS